MEDPSFGVKSHNTQPQKSVPSTSACPSERGLIKIDQCEGRNFSSTSQNSLIRSIEANSLAKGDITRPTIATQEQSSFQFGLKKNREKVNISQIIDELKHKFYEQIDISKFATYIHPQGKYSSYTEGILDVLAEIEVFLKDDRQHSCLVQGDSGLGKSTLAQYFAHQLWESNTSDEDWIPLLIHLPAIPKRKRQGSLLNTFLKQLRLKEKQRNQLCDHAKLLLILDGYDEVADAGNLWLHNRWPVSQTKILTLCRPEVLLQRQATGSYRQWFYPFSSNGEMLVNLKEIQLQSFTPEQIEEYINLHILHFNDGLNTHNPEETYPLPDRDWYLKYINEIPGLRELVTNPFLLEMVVKVLPRIIEKNNLAIDESKTKASEDKSKGKGKDTGEESEEISFSSSMLKPITRTMIYDAFVSQWFNEQARRIQKKEPHFYGLLQGPLIKYLRIYAENLAYRVLCSGKLNVVIKEDITLEPALLEPQESEMSEYYANDEKIFNEEGIKIIRSGCLLKTENSQFSFLHKSLLEYFAAKDLFNSIVTAAEFILQKIIRNEKVEDIVEVGETISPSESLKLYSFNDQLLTTELGILQVLADEVKKDDNFKEILFNVIDYSKNNPMAGNAASNAITILNLARVPLSGKNFEGIQIPGANLTKAILHGTNLENADLSGACLNQAYLERAKLKNAYLKDIDFCENAYFDTPSTRANMGLVDYCYSPDGSKVAGIGPNNFFLWEAATGKLLYQESFTGHNILSTVEMLGGLLKDAISNSANTKNPYIALLSPPWLTFSQDSAKVAACILTDIIIIDINRKKINYFPYSRYDNQLLSFNFDDSGQLIGFFLGNDQNSILKYEIESNTLLSTIEIDGSCEGLKSTSNNSLIALFDGQQISIVDHSGKPKELGIRSTKVYDVSTRGDLLATLELSDQNIILIWNLNHNNKEITCQLMKKLHGHRERVDKVIFNNDGNLLASGSNKESTIRIWDIGTQACIRLINLENSMYSINFSPDNLSFIYSNVMLSETSLSGEPILSMEPGLCSHHIQHITLRPSLSNELFFKNDGKISSLPNGKLICINNDASVQAWHDNGQIIIWNNAAKIQLRQITNFYGPEITAAFNQKGNFFVYLTLEFIPNLINLDCADEENIVINFNSTVRYCAMALSSDGKILAVTTDSHLKLLSVPEGRILNKFSFGINLSMFFMSLCFTATDELISYYGFMADQISIINLKNHKKQIMGKGYWGQVLDIYRNGNKAGGMQKMIINEDIATGGRSHHLHPDKTGEFLIVTTKTGRINVWNLALKKIVFSLFIQKKINSFTFFSDDRETITNINEEGEKTIWQRQENETYVLVTDLSNKVGLICDQADITGAVGLSENQIALLRQKGARGKPSVRKAYSPQPSLSTLPDINDQRPVVKSKNLYSTVKPALPVSYENWVVSILRHPRSNNPDHAILILEGVNTFGKGILIKLHLVDSRNEPGQALILVEPYLNIEKKDIKDIFIKDIAKQQEFYCKSWGISRTQALFLWNEAKSDQQKIIYYHISGDRSIFAKSSKISKDGTVHNCFSWAREKLHNLRDSRIQLPERYIDRIGAKTSFYIGHEQEDKSTCLLM